MDVTENHSQWHEPRMQPEAFDLRYRLDTLVQTALHGITLSDATPTRRKRTTAMQERDAEITVQCLDMGLVLLAELLTTDSAQRGGLLENLRRKTLTDRLGIHFTQFKERWEDQLKYRENVLEYAIAELIRATTFKNTMAAMETTEKLQPTDVVRIVGGAALEGLGVGNSLGIRLRLLLTAAHESHPIITDGLKVFHDFVNQSVELIMRDLLAANGIQFKQPADVESYVLQVSMLADGFLQQAIAEGFDTADYALFLSAANALFTAYAVSPDSTPGVS